MEPCIRVNQYWRLHLSNAFCDPVRSASLAKYVAAAARKFGLARVLTIFCINFSESGIVDITCCNALVQFAYGSSVLPSTFPLFDRRY